MTRNVALITPVVYPAPGGGAIYTKLLAEGLARDADTAAVLILTEAFPGEPRSSIFHNKVRYLRIFPFRAGRSRVDLLSYAAYAWQNFQFLRLGEFFGPIPDVVLVHSSLHYKRNFLSAGLTRLKRVNPNLKLVLDIRDPLVSTSLKGALRNYDAVIVCSESASSKFRAVADNLIPVFHIPIIFEPVQVDAVEVQRVRSKFGLNHPYVITTNGVRYDKGLGDTIQLVRSLRAEVKDLRLVIVGRERHVDSNFAQAVSDDLAINLGPLDHAQTLALVAGSEMHINLSTVEGLPRGSLEAMWLGARTILPPNIPEFIETVPELVANNQSSSDLLSQAHRLLCRPGTRPAYPFQNHFSENVCQQYLYLIDDLVHPPPGKS